MVGLLVKGCVDVICVLIYRDWMKRYMGLALYTPGGVAQIVN